MALPSALLKISVTTTVEAADTVAEWLGKIFCQSASTDTSFATGRTVVSVYCDTAPRAFSSKRAALRDGLQRIKSFGLNLGAGTIRVQKLSRQDWAESWKRHFKPIEIGNALLIKPSWSKRRPRASQAVVVLDPGLSFGTGQHPTTEFCLRELVRAWERRRHPCRRNCRGSLATRRQGCRRSQGCSFLDIGTGSGILAIAAAKLGYAPVRAFDFDPKCIVVARENAKANHVANRIKLACADLAKPRHRSRRRYDVICANLLADVLINQRERIIARLKPTGTLVVAGILKREFDEVVAAYRAVGMKLIVSKAQKEWRSGTFAFR